jgi:WD40 repeat protein
VTTTGGGRWLILRGEDVSRNGQIIAEPAPGGMRINSTTPTGTSVRFVPSGSNVSASALSPNGRLLATSENEEITFWDTATGKRVGEFDFGWAETAYDIVFSPDGKLLAVLDEEGIVTFWNTETYSRTSASIQEGPVDAWDAIAFSPDGRLLVTCSEDESDVELWDLSTGRLARTLPPPAPGRGRRSRCSCLQPQTGNFSPSAIGMARFSCRTRPLVPKSAPYFPQAASPIICRLQH